MVPGTDFGVPQGPAPGLLQRAVQRGDRPPSRVLHHLDCRPAARCSAVGGGSNERRSPAMVSVTPSAPQPSPPGVATFVAGRKRGATHLQFRSEGRPPRGHPGGRQRDAPAATNRGFTEVPGRGRRATAARTRIARTRLAGRRRGGDRDRLRRRNDPRTDRLLLRWTDDSTTSKRRTSRPRTTSGPCGTRATTSIQDVLLLEADVVFDPQIVTALLDVPGNSAAVARFAPPLSGTVVHCDSDDRVTSFHAGRRTGAGVRRRDGP